ncbi:MAG: DUF222 domain-containing protein [Nocardioidaceae bacterium]
MFGQSAVGNWASVNDGVAALDVEGALAAAGRARLAADAAEARLLAVAAHYADLHPAESVLVPIGTSGWVEATPGRETVTSLGGEGTPSVAEFAAVELGAVLKCSTGAAQQLIGRALELRHRLPLCWARVLGGRLPAWRAGRIADQTRALSVEAAAFVDAQVAPFAHKIGSARLEALVQAAIIRCDPETARTAEQAAADSRGAFLAQRGEHGVRAISIRADEADALGFDTMLTTVADQLARLGDADKLDVRRAKALGWLADPHAALDLFTRDPDVVQPAAIRPPRPKATLHVHVSLADLATRSGRPESGVARVEGIGPVTLQKAREWLDRGGVAASLRLSPVLDLHGTEAVDSYEVPDRIAETVLLRTPCCPFPYCPNTSRRKDLDHITDYVDPDEGGPPGQTGPANLAGLCRRHHRVKTHGHWDYTMPEPGIYSWRSPTGRRYLVDHTGTQTIEHV